jgi:hypothetical protein
VPFLIERGAHRGQQIVIATGFDRKSTAPPFIARTLVGTSACPADEYRRQVVFACDSFSLASRPENLGQTHVQHQAARAAVMLAAQEVCYGAERLRRITGRPQQSLEASAYRGIVVDDEYNRVICVHG